MHYSSGRVVALGRLLQASLFLLAMILDESHQAPAATPTYVLLSFYVVFAIAIAVATWSNWWLDARLAGPAHAVDILMFTLLVLATEGYTSPFFAFFVFLLLAAAIRWSWLATALTAFLLTLLYLVAGLWVAQSAGAFQLQWFVIRTGHLAILSLILIWFGATQWRTRYYRGDDLALAYPSLDESPIDTGLRAAMGAMRASGGLFLWRGNQEEGQEDAFAGPAIRDGAAETVSVPVRLLGKAVPLRPFLYDVANDRGLTRDANRNLPEVVPSDIVPPQTISKLALGEGLAIPIRSDEGEGVLFLEDVAGLSIDHIDLGEQLAADIAAHIQRHALLESADASAEARSRLSLARDLHDSVVQFLAGAAFRLEAMKRAEASGRPLEGDLNELKQLMLEEQGELRNFIVSLRGGAQVPLDDLSSDLRDLAGRLSRQWSIRCRFSAKQAETMIPTRLRLNANQLMREAVANAVRHAGAKSVTVSLAVEDGRLRLDFLNDGAGFPKRDGRTELPQSLQERVEQARGAIDLSRTMNGTRISIWLPIGGGRR